MLRLRPSLARMRVVALCGLALLCSLVGASRASDAPQVTLNEVIASPSSYRDTTLRLEGLVADARLARSPEGRTCSFALVSPNSNMGLAILGADPPEEGTYVSVEGPLRLDPRLNTPYIESPRVTVLRELALWLRPTDHQTLAALASILCAAMACLLTMGVRRARSRPPSQRAFETLLAQAVLPASAAAPPLESVEEASEPAPERDAAEPAGAGAEEPGTTDAAPEPTPTEAADEVQADATPEPTPIVDFVLEVVSGPDRGKVFEARGSRITIGRSDDRDVALSDDLIARHQATLTRSNGAVLLCSEVPGTVVCLNSRPIRQAEIAAHDIIRMGCSELRVIAPMPVSDEGPLVPAR